MAVSCRRNAIGASPGQCACVSADPECGDRPVAEDRQFHLRQLGMAELIVHGAHRTVHCCAFSYQRVAEGRPFRELNII